MWIVKHSEEATEGSSTMAAFEDDVSYAADFLGTGAWLAAQPQPSTLRSTITESRSQLPCLHMK